MFEPSSVTDLSCPELDLFLAFALSDEYAFDIRVLFPDDEEDELLIAFPLALTNVDLLIGELLALLDEADLISGEEVVFCDIFDVW